jgi:hypothetical protein
MTSTAPIIKETEEPIPGSVPVKPVEVPEHQPVEVPEPVLVPARRYHDRLA